MYHLYWTGDLYDACFLTSGTLEDLKTFISSHPDYRADDLEIYKSAPPELDIYEFVEEARRL